MIDKLVAKAARLRLGPGTAEGVQTPPGPRADGHVTCPWCGSEEVELVGVVGPTTMTSQWICTACSNPFERIRRRERR